MKTRTFHKHRIALLVAALSVLVFAVSPTQAAQKWSVYEAASEPSGEWQLTTTNTFVIVRDTAYSNSFDVVNYRTVNLSAFAGEQYTAASGQLTFAPGEYSKNVPVEEKWTVNASFLYRVGDRCSYLFEVLDEGGFSQSSIVREMKTVVNVPISGLFDERCVDMFGDCYYPYIVVTDDGFDQFGEERIHDVYQDILNVNRESFGLTNLPTAFLNSIGAELRMTFDLKAHELQDGFQHVQVLVDKAQNLFDDNASSSDPGTPYYSSYLACFSHYEHALLNGFETYSFPVTTTGDNEGASKPWLADLQNQVGELKKQRFNTDCRAVDGRLLLPFDFNTITFRFDASGDDEDDWSVGELFNVYVQIAESTRPRLVPTITNSVAICPGPYARGNTVRISLAFSEIVTIPNTTTLSTTWGDFHYETGNGGNVLTFCGTIDAPVGTSLTVSKTGLNAVTDLVGNSFYVLPGDYKLKCTVEELPTCYDAWANANGVSGAWNEKGTDGIYNVFRYSFNRPTGAFADPPLLDIAIEGDNAVVKTPPVLNTVGFAVSVVESSDVAGAGVTRRKPLDATGRTMFAMGSAASRFYRLSATEGDVELVDIPVTSILWVDNYDADGNRPASVTVRLYADRVEVDSHVLTADEDWQFTFAGKPRYQEDGTTEIAYTVGEDAVAMYAATVSGYTIFNEYRPELTSVSVSKVWHDNNDSECKRPSSIWMTLSNGQMVKLDTANGWTATISDLPTVLNGQPVQYTWSEQSVLDYELESVTQQGNLTIFTNKTLSPSGPSPGTRPKPGGGGYGDEDPEDDTPP